MKKTTDYLRAYFLFNYICWSKFMDLLNKSILKSKNFVWNELSFLDSKFNILMILKFFGSYSKLIIVIYFLELFEKI